MEPWTIDTWRQATAGWDAELATWTMPNSGLTVWACRLTRGERVLWGAGMTADEAERQARWYAYGQDTSRAWQGLAL
jgi:hypothetical protein